MKTLLAFVPFAVALPIVVYAAVWQGNQTERWGKFERLGEAAKRVDDIPLEVGDWKGTRAAKLSEALRHAAGAEGDAEIAYVNSKGDRVNVFVVCGRLEDVMDHRPDRCYPASGYKPEGESMPHVVVTETGAKAQLQTATYSREGQQALDRIYWAWSTNGKWLAPEDEDLRNDFKRTDPIFKVHFATAVAKANQSLDEGPSVELIKVLIPEMSRVLFPGFQPPPPPAKDSAAKDSAAKDNAAKG